MNVLQFQLAIQIPASLIGSRVLLSELEDELTAHSHGLGKIDSITSNEDETDVFISTNDPQRLFQHYKSYLSSVAILDKIQAAYRHSNAEHYTVIWPKEDDDGCGMVM